MIEIPPILPVTEMRGGIPAVRLYRNPEIKIVGYEIRTSGILGDRIEELLARVRRDGLHARFRDLPRLVPADLGWSGNYTEEDQTFSYLVGCFVPLDFPVPPGWDWRTLPSGLIAKGIRGQGYRMVETYDSWGYTQNYDQRGWNADVFFDVDSDDGTWTNITPVRPKTNPADRWTPPPKREE